MSKQTKIRPALVAHLLSSPAILPADRLFFDNQPGNIPTTGTWGLVQFSSTPGKPDTLGTGGQDEYTGTLTVLVTVPTGQGTKAAEQVVDKLAQRFVAGQSITREGQTVIVTSAGASMSSSFLNRIPFVVSWKAKVNRIQA